MWMIININDFFVYDMFHFHFSNSLLVRIPLSFLTAWFVIIIIIIILLIKELKPSQTSLADVSIVTRLTLTMIAADTESSI